MEETSDKSQVETVIKRRDDGTRSSVNQVDANGMVHGMRVTYYPDGKTIYSKHSFDHAVKQGPSVWYYRSGQVFKHINYKDGKKDGPARVYYKNGNLTAEFEYKNGKVLPGMKEYDREGKLVTGYPDIAFREIDQLAAKNRIDLEVFCAERKRGVKYFLIEENEGKESRTYLISENSAALMQFYVKPGDQLIKKIEIMAEIPTELGNVMARKLTYHLSAANLK
jgi:hypothetical protein